VRNELDVSSEPDDGSEAVEVHASTSTRNIAIRWSFATAGGRAS